MSNAISERYIYNQVKKVFPDTQHNRLMCLKNRDVELDVFVDSLYLAIEYDGPHHRHRVQKDESKNYRLRQAGIQLIRIREEGLPPLRPFGCVIIEHRTDSQLDVCIDKIFDFVAAHFPLGDDTLSRMGKLPSRQG